tara:strand:+ start:485 stop:646 length:162 start_codon:yes stop_codon:yes gene_type:complete
MKTLRNLLGVTFFILTAYSCEPEELPQEEILNQTNISADTGDKADEVEDRKEG